VQTCHSQAQKKSKKRIAKGGAGNGTSWGHHIITL
jgi:hypothetical protein